MKIIIERNSKKKLSFHVPLILMKSKSFLLMISKNINEDDKKNIKLIPTLYKDVKKYIKSNGHFTLLEVDSNQGDKVQIII